MTLLRHVVLILFFCLKLFLVQVELRILELNLGLVNASLWIVLGGVVA